MIINKYVKLLLFLGLFAVVPAQGMSYVKSGIEKMQSGAFYTAIKLGYYDKAFTLVQTLPASSQKDAFEYIGNNLASIKGSQGVFFINNLFSEYPEYNIMLTRKALQNIDLIVNARAFSMLKFVVERCSDSSIFIDAVAKNFKYFHTDWPNGRAIIDLLLIKYASQFIQAVGKQDTLLKDDLKSLWLHEALIRTHSTVDKRDLFNELLIDHCELFARTTPSYISLNILLQNLDKYPGMQKRIIEKFIRDFDLIVKHCQIFTLNIIENCDVINNPQLCLLFKKYLVEQMNTLLGQDNKNNFSMFNIEIFAALMKNNEIKDLFEATAKPRIISLASSLTSKSLLDLYTELSDNEIKRRIADVLVSRNMTPGLKKFIDKCNKTQTGAHILSNPIVLSKVADETEREKKISQSLAFFGADNENYGIGAYEKFSTDVQLKGILDGVLETEKKYYDDHYTFVHGQRREYYFPEKLYSFLWSLKKRKSLNNFFFAHVADLIESPEDIALEKVQRNFLLNNHTYDENNRKKLLFMNYALFANSLNLGSNSAFYIMKNTNSPMGTMLISAQDSFKKLGYESIYSRFKKEIESLASEHLKLSNYGNIFCIAIPKETIHKYVFPAVSGGTKRAIHIDGIGETSDIKIIMETLRHSPEKMKNTDQLEFCLIMTQKKGGLDPDTGIKIIPILSGDPAKLAELQKKEDALFAKIKAAIEQEENAKAQATAVNRANTIVNHLVLPSKDAQGVVPEKTMARINMIMNHI